MSGLLPPDSCACNIVHVWANAHMQSTCDGRSCWLACSSGIAGAATLNRLLLLLLLQIGQLLDHAAH
eukprot:1638897-Alexandrium_andersonii.AAC.1